MANRKARAGGLAKAIAAAGSITALAAKLKLTVQAVSQWDDVPAERCREVEKVTGVSRYVLRPDIYGTKPRRDEERLSA
jgi:DNA-binding transcriptional regulator YdaS (Cro superfamily)